MNSDDDNLPSGIIRAAPRKPPTQPTPEPDTPVARLPKAPTPQLPNYPITSSTSRVSALEPQERHKDRVNVYVDGKFVMGVFADVAATLGLKIGQAVTPERLEELARAETRRKAKEDAYRLLSFRARAEKEIADRLRQKGYEDDVITETLESLRGLGFVDDGQFASAWVSSRGKTRGKQALAFELRQKGVDKETARDVLNERTGGEESEVGGKFCFRLGRRGFGWETVRAVLADLYGRFDDADEEGDGDEPGDV
jgi:regulatory protein